MSSGIPGKGAGLSLERGLCEITDVSSILPQLRKWSSGQGETEYGFVFEIEPIKS